VKPPRSTQIEALSAVVELGSQAAAAQRIGISERAVKARLATLRNHLRVETTEQAVYVGRARGWLTVRKFDGSMALGT
jgi:molybdenum-dependent DNA-binding transcriptional regulator ModE